METLMSQIYVIDFQNDSWLVLELFVFLNFNKSLDHGTASGIQDPVDFNIFHLQIQDFESLIDQEGFAWSGYSAKK